MKLFTPIQSSEVDLNEDSYITGWFREIGNKMNKDQQHQITAEAARSLRLTAERHGLKITDDVEFAWRDDIEAATEKAIAASYGIVPSTVQPPTGSVLATESRAAHASDEYIQCPQCGWHPVRKEAR